MTNFKSYARIAITKVLALGGTREEIAASLTRLGCKGSLRNEEDCVMHNYLAEIPELAPVSGLIAVNTNAMFVGLAAITPPAAADEDNLTLPAHVWDFISRYDDEEFPALVRTDPEDFTTDEDDDEDEDEDDFDDDDLDDDDDDFDDDEDDFDDDEEE
jgi:hypothetical protein